jgi:hypothetical protein
MKIKNFLKEDKQLSKFWFDNPFSKKRKPKDISDAEAVRRMPLKRMK